MLICRRDALGGIFAGGLTLAWAPRANTSAASIMLDAISSPEDVTAAVIGAAKKGESVILRGGELYHTKGGIVTFFAVRLSGNGILQVDEPGHSALHIWGAGEPVDGVSIRGVTFAQPASPGFGGGTRNNHTCLKLSGVRAAAVSNVEFIGVGSRGADLGLHVGYGERTMADRASIDVAVLAVRGRHIRGIGLEIFGSRDGDFRELTFTGDDGKGGLGLMEGVRLTSYDFAHNFNNTVEAQVSRFQIGLSVQGYSFNNSAKLDVSDCAIGVHVHGVEEKRGPTDVSRNNIFHVVARRCGHAIYDGGSDNSFYLDALDCGSHGILATGGRGASGVGSNNRYSGSIRGFSNCGADIRGDRAVVNFTIAGRGRRDSEFGFKSAGRELRGNLQVSGVRTGVILAGSGADISTQISDCQTALVINGDGNIVRCDVEGAVVVTGRGNRLLGQIRGPVRLSGSDNHNDTST